MKGPNELFLEDKNLDSPYIRNSLIFSDYSRLEQELFNLKKRSSHMKMGVLFVQKVKFRDRSEKTYRSYSLRFGNENSRKKILIVAGQHGGEVTPVAAYYMAKEFSNPKTRLSKRLLKEAEVSILPCIDPFGYESKLRRFYHPYTGKSLWWPTDSDQLWTDVNEWKRIKVKELEACKKYITDFFEDARKGKAEGLLIDNHETVQIADDMRFTSDIVESAEPSIYQFASERGLLSIEETKNSKLGAAVVNNLYKHGKVPFKFNFLYKFLSKLQAVKEVEEIADGRVEAGELFHELQFFVLSKYAKDELGVDSITFESMSKDLGKRMEEHLIATEGAILEFMGYQPPMALDCLLGKGTSLKEIKGDKFKLKRGNLKKFASIVNGLKEVHLYPEYLNEVPWNLTNLREAFSKNRLLVAEAPGITITYSRRRLKEKIGIGVAKDVDLTPEEIYKIKGEIPKDYLTEKEFKQLKLIRNLSSLWMVLGRILREIWY